MGEISFSGLSSGLDTTSMIESLMQIERSPIIRMQVKQTTINQKKEAFQQFESQLKALQSSASKLTDSDTFVAFQASTNANSTVSASIDRSASPGTYTIEVLETAQSEQISSAIFSSKTEGLNLSGEMLINGELVSISTSDALLDISSKINKAKTGASASVISINSTDHRLIITSEKTGESGIAIAEGGSSNFLETLGFNDGSTQFKNSVVGGVQSNDFSSRTASIKSLLSLNASQSGTVQINGTSIAIDLENDSLSDIKDAINTAGLSGEIVETTEKSVTSYQLKINNASSFVDDNNILQKLGVIEGTRSGIAQELTGSVANTESGSNITASTLFSNIDGATATDSTSAITIGGRTHDGTLVNGTYTYQTGDTVQDFLTILENSFGLSAGSASIQSGKLVVTDDQSGQSSLQISLAEADFGSLDLGEIQITSNGRSRELQSGNDAQLKVNNINITNSSNSIVDVIQGVTINAKNTNAATGDAPVVMRVTPSYSEAEGAINDFVDKYNSVRQFITDQFTYDEGAKRAGLLFGDSTLRSTQIEIHRVLSETVSGLDGDFSRLTHLGINTDQDGIVSVDSGKLRTALETSVDDVASVFLGQGSVTDPDLTFINFTKDTQGGTFNVNITTAAEQGTISGSGAIDAGGLGADETLTVTDLGTNMVATIDLKTGDAIDEIVSKVNSTLQSKITEIHTSDTANTSTAGGDLTATSTFAEVSGANAQNGDTITIDGTDRNGTEISTTYSITTTNTIQDLLDTIQNAYSNKVTAKIENGFLSVTDNTSGKSNLTITLTENNESGATLDFGAISASTEGRNELSISAENDNGTLKLTHDRHGLAEGIKIVSDQSGATSTQIGTTEIEDYGVNVAGTINGETATGVGRFLTGDDGNANTDGLRIRADVTATQLLTQGSAQGSVTTTFGIAEQFDRLMDSFLDSVDGRVTQRIDGFGDSYDRVQNRIDRMELRLAQVELRYKSTFLAMEKMIGQIKSQGDYLTSQLKNLSASSNNN